MFYGTSLKSYIARCEMIRVAFMKFQEFKEAFNMIDQNRDGFIDVQDLQDMFASLGSYH